MNRLLNCTLITIVVLLLVVGCTPAKGKQASGIFIDGTSAGDAETLNWIIAADSASFSYIGHTMDSLATYNNDWEVQLRCAAKDVEVSEDGLVYTVTIRDDLKWSDGSQVTAEDYVYTLKNLMFSDWLNYPYGGDWQETVNGEEVFVTAEVVDTTTFTITRQTIYPKYIAVKYEGDVEAFTQAPEFNNLTYTGNLGPYKFEEWVRNDKYVVARNPDYYLGKDVGAPYFDKFITKLFGTSATLHAALEAGDITYAGIDSPQVAKFKKMEHLNVFTIPTRSYVLLTYNLRNNGWEGFKQKEVRQAVSLAISKGTLIRQVMTGFGEPAFSFIPNTSPWYVDEGLSKYGVKPLYDKEKAKELLYEAGYGAKKADGSIEVVNKDDKPLKLVLLTNSGNEENENTCFLIQQELSAIGIEVEVKPVPWATLLRSYYMNKVPGSDQEPRYNNGPEAVSEEPWDMIVGILATNVLAPSGSDIFFASEGGLNFFGYSNPKVDELFKKTKSKEALDQSARKQIYAELSQLLSEEQPVDFLAFPLANVGFQKKVKGLEPGMRMFYNYHLWYLEE